MRMEGVVLKGRRARYENDLSDNYPDEGGVGDLAAARVSVGFVS